MKVWYRLEKILLIKKYCIFSLGNYDEFSEKESHLCVCKLIRFIAVDRVPYEDREFTRFIILDSLNNILKMIAEMECVQLLLEHNMYHFSGEDYQLLDVGWAIYDLYVRGRRSWRLNNRVRSITDGKNM